MDRRRLLVTLGAGCALVALAACGDGGAAADHDAQRPGFEVENLDDSGHLHAFHIGCDDLVASEARSYPTDGESHAHTVTLGAPELARLAAGEVVTVTFTDGHQHTFVIEVPAGSC